MFVTVFIILGDYMCFRNWSKYHFSSSKWLFVLWFRKVK